MNLEPIISTLKYEIKLIDKLSKSKDYLYYIPHIFLLLLKHYADFLLSKDVGKYVVSFDYISILKEKNVIDDSDEFFIRKCVEMTRRRDSLVKEYMDLDTSLVERVIFRLKVGIEGSV